MPAPWRAGPVPDDRGAEPHNGCMGPARRARIAAIARRFDLQVIEDDCYTVSDTLLPRPAVAGARAGVACGQPVEDDLSGAAVRLGDLPFGHGRGGRLRLTAQHNFLCPAAAGGAAGAASAGKRRGGGDPRAGEGRVRGSAAGDGGTIWAGVRPALAAGGALRLAAAAAGLARLGLCAAARRARGCWCARRMNMRWWGGGRPMPCGLAVAGNLPREVFDGALAKLARLLRNPRPIWRCDSAALTRGRGQRRRAGPDCGAIVAAACGPWAARRPRGRIVA